MRETNLGDGVVVTRADEQDYLVLKILKHAVPLKKFELKEVGKNKDGTAIYEVPKSDIYAYYAAPLADGSVLTCMRRKEIPYARRLELFNAGIAAGLDVRPVEPSKTKDKGTGLTLEGLMSGAFKAKPSSGKNKASNEL